MTMRNLNGMWAKGTARAGLWGRFQPEGSNPVDNTKNIGRGFTAARNGDYTVTFDQVGVELLDFDAKPWGPASVGARIENGPYTPATASAKATMQFFITDAAGAPLDIAADPDAWISISAVFNNGQNKKV